MAAATAAGNTQAVRGVGGERLQIGLVLERRRRRGLWGNSLIDKHGPVRRINTPDILQLSLDVKI
jgi:hypothetical protein